MDERPHSREELRPIVFIGTMNAMPMMYAVELRELGCKVAYVVDVPQSDLLSRPEHHFPGITYPYPPWILEFTLPTQLLSALVPRLVTWLLRRKLAKLGIALDDAVVVTTGFHHRLLDYLSANTVKIALSFGADLDTWAFKPGAARLHAGLKGRSIFRFLPSAVGRRLIARIVNRQFSALEGANGVIYFARGLNDQGDRITDALEARGVRVVRRHDVSPHPVKNGVAKLASSRQAPLFLLSPVRFLFRTFVEGCAGYDKGNDRILEGVAQFSAENIPFELHLFEKGEDVDAAHELVDALGLHEHVIWHKEMPFNELLRLYERADIVFDQVGSHWMGATGIYALYLGLPLIANVTNLVDAGIIPREHPISNAATAADVRDQLVRLANEPDPAWSPDQARDFALTYFGPARVVRYIEEMAERP